VTASSAATGTQPASTLERPSHSKATLIARTILREIRDYPATAVFSASWIAVFVAMVWLQFYQHSPPTWWRFVVLGIGGGDRFGDLTLRGLERGQVWRLMTCTFVHYSVVHLSLNLVAFYLLGTLIESWYGSSQLILVYGLTGGGGNLLSALTRHALGSDPNSHAGGGSVVVMGLIGLCAVVGWRSRTARGSDLGWQMTKALGITVVIGIALRPYIDNWGHAGGTIVGLALGLFHRVFLRRYAGPRAWGTGVLMALVIGGCVLAQYRLDRTQSPIRRDEASWMGLHSRRLDLESRGVAYRSLRDAQAVLTVGADPRLLAVLMERAAPVLDQGPSRSEFRRLRELAQAAASRALTDPERDEFKGRAGPLATQLRSELRTAHREYRGERSSLWERVLQRARAMGPLVRRTPSR
jgi:membrane associated rhomboid family serine protease